MPHEEGGPMVNLVFNKVRVPCQHKQTSVPSGNPPHHFVMITATSLSDFMFFRRGTT